MKTIIVLLSLFTMACSQIVPSRVDVVQSGTSTTEVTVSLRVIDQIKSLCTAQMAPLYFNSIEEREAAVAECTFEHLSSVTSTASLNVFAEQYCQPWSDLSAFTPEQQVSIDSACIALGY